METATCTYNVRSWPTKVAGQRLTERLCYNESVEGLSPTITHRYRWNGTVAAYSWKAGGATTQRGYSLMYDGLDRLTRASYGEGTYLTGYRTIYDEAAAYDDMGNPTWIYRKSPVTLTDNRPSSASDRLRLEYDGNRLVSVTDSVTSGHSYSNAFHFADGADTDEEYEYDDNGNMTKDLNRGITGVTYNFLNLPSVITFGDGSYIEYTYDAGGARLRTKYGVQAGVGPLTPSGTGNTGSDGDGTASPDSQASLPSQDELSRIDYCGNVIYDRGERKLLLENGYVTFDSQTNAPSYHFYLRDHLGNNRVVMARDGTVEQVTHYYPFGGVMRESTNPGLQPYKYGGKEFDRTSGLDAYDFGARTYFADRLQWGQMDPLCEKYYDWSPYAYCIDSPIKYIDKDGKKPGDFFLTMDMAALDFGQIYNNNSILKNREFAASLFIIYKNGQRGFTYTVPSRGKMSKSNPSLPPFGVKQVASIHTHGAAIDENGISQDYNHFTGHVDGMTADELKGITTITMDNADIAIPNNKKIIAYLACPDGSLKKYNPQTGEINIISIDLPSDNRDYGRLNNNDPVNNQHNHVINRLLYYIDVMFKALGSKSYNNFHQ